MAEAGNWVWERGGPYFGVPLRNYLGWLVTTFLIYVAVGWLWRRVGLTTPARGIFAALPVIAYAFFAVRYMTPNHIPALQVVAVFSMGLPGFIALVRVLMTAP
jgi:putative membrane protein